LLEKIKENNGHLVFEKYVNNIRWSDILKIRFKLIVYYSRNSVMFAFICICTWEKEKDDI